MKRSVLAISFVSSLALALVAGCGSSSGGGGGSGGSGGSSGADLNCAYKSTGFEVCYSYTGLPSATESALKSACTAEPGATTPSACPTANQSGCCESIPGGAGTETYTYGYCYYSVPSSDTSTLESACKSAKGTWSAK